MPKLVAVQGPIAFTFSDLGVGECSYEESLKGLPSMVLPKMRHLDVYDPRAWQRCSLQRHLDRIPKP